jgi:hypothetical protein
VTFHGVESPPVNDVVGINLRRFITVDKARMTNNNTKHQNIRMVVESTVVIYDFVLFKVSFCHASATRPSFVQTKRARQPSATHP